MASKNILKNLKRAVINVLSYFVRGRFYKRKNLTKSIFLNVGCGKNPHPDFVNLDYTLWPGVDICWDLRRPLPFSNESFDGIFTEHCLEHLSYFDCLNNLEEFHRILRPGGVIRIIVPDGGLYLSLYARSHGGHEVHFPYIGEAGRKDLEEDSAVMFTPMMAVNRIFRSYGHRFAYDCETMSSMLSHVGFIDVAERSFGVGASKFLLIDSAYRAPQSLYLEAKKRV